MHPAHQFTAFRRSVDDGRSVEDVAKRFGATVLLVTQRLKLARVSPHLIKLYREEELTLEQLMAVTCPMTARCKKPHGSTRPTMIVARAASAAA
jgi:hypothetical protein